jgi:hypothetical protein
MKHLLILFWFTCLPISSVLAQSPSSLPEPEFEMQPYWYDEASKSLRSFEKVPFQTQTRATGLYGAEGLAFIEGRESPIQFKNVGNLIILVKIEKGKDPSDLLSICQFKVRKKRELVVSKRSSWDGGTTNKTAGLAILEFKKIREGIYQIILTQRLERGEYAFANGKSFFAFGIE